jgi:hypothetical protein
VHAQQGRQGDAANGNFVAGTTLIEEAVIIAMRGVGMGNRPPIRVSCWPSSS